MKWAIIFGTILIVIVAAIIRRKMLERQPPPAPPVWDSREPMKFDDFYAQYYANSGLAEAVVFKLLDFISLSSGIEYQRLRPEDPLDSFPKGSLRKNVLEFAEIMVRATRNAEKPNERFWFDPNIDTVDDFIRKLGPLAARVEEHHRQLHHSS